MLEQPSTQPDNTELTRDIATANRLLDAYECSSCTDKDIAEEAKSALESLQNTLEVNIDSCSKKEIKELQSLVDRFSTLFGEDVSITMSLLKINSTLEVGMGRILAKEALMRKEAEAKKAVAQAG